MLKFVNPWTGECEKARIVTDEYFNDRLFVGLITWDTEFDFWGPYCDVTVNIPNATITNHNCGFVDTNNAEFLPGFLIQNGLGVPTGRFARSGRCTYPEFDFTRLIEGDSNELEN